MISNLITKQQFDIIKYAAKKSIIFGFNIRFPYLLMTTIKHIVTRKESKVIRLQLTLLIKHIQTLSIITTSYKFLKFMLQNHTGINDDLNTILSACGSCTLMTLYLKNNNKVLREMDIYMLSLNLLYMIYTMNKKTNYNILNIKTTSGVVFHSICITTFIVYFSKYDKTIIKPEFRYLYHDNKIVGNNHNLYFYLFILLCIFNFEKF